MAFEDNFPMNSETNAKGSFAGASMADFSDPRRRPAVSLSDSNKNDGKPPSSVDFRWICREGSSFLEALLVDAPNENRFANFSVDVELTVP